MEEQVANGFAIDEAAQGSVAAVDDAQGQADEVVQLGQEESAPGSGTTVEPTTPDDEAQPTSQKDFNRALGLRMEQERNRLQRSEEYLLGSMLLEERARRDGVSRGEAFKRIQQERDEALAQDYANDPKKFYRDYISQQRRTPAVQEQQEAPEAQARRIGQELGELQASGQLPAGFDLKGIDQGTYNDMVTYGTRAALAIWAAKNPAQAELKRRQNGPAPMRPSSPNQRGGQVDYSAMSSDEYRKKQAEIDRAVLSGKRVRLS